MKKLQGFDLRNDHLFKKALGSPGCEENIAHFLRDVMGIPVESVAFLPTENHGSQQVADVGKERSIGLTRVDLLAQLAGGAQVTVEMQRQPQQHFAERMLFYMGKGYVNNYSDAEEAKDKYASLRPVYGVNIVEYDFHTDAVMTCPVTRYRLLEEKHHQPLVSQKTGQELLMVCIFELKKVNGSSPLILQYWQSLFVNGTVPVEAPQYLQDIAWIIAYENMGTEEREMVIRTNDARDTYYEEMFTAIAQGEEKGRKEGRAEGRAEGRTAGENSKAREIAVESLKNGASIEFTAKITGLSQQEVQKLAEKSK